LTLEVLSQEDEQGDGAQPIRHELAHRTLHVPLTFPLIRQRAVRDQDRIDRAERCGGGVEQLPMSIQLREIGDILLDLGSPTDAQIVSDRLEFVSTARNQEQVSAISSEELGRFLCNR
jgi:hypothetical protein